MIGYWALKALVSGAIVATVSEVARRYPAGGALIASLPLVSILGMVWLWRDTRDPVRLAAHAGATFWYVLPSLPIFLIVPALLRGGVGFVAALSCGCVVTVVLYAAMVAGLSRVGIAL